MADDGDWFVVKLPKPMGVDVDARNALLRLAPGGAADRGRTLSIGDQLIYIDGNEVRNRCSTLAAAMDDARELRTVVARRPPPPGGRRAAGVGRRRRAGGAAALRDLAHARRRSLGLSLDDANVVVEVYAEAAAAAEGACASATSCSASTARTSPAGADGSSTRSTDDARATSCWCNAPPRPVERRVAGAAGRSCR